MRLRNIPFRKTLIFWSVLLVQGMILNFVGSGSTCRAADIAGTITDQTGAVLVEVRVLVHEISAGVQFELKTDDTGRFRLEGIQPGSYSVSARAGGFLNRLEPWSSTTKMKWSGLILYSGSEPSSLMSPLRRIEGNETLCRFLSSPNL